MKRSAFFLSLWFLLFGSTSVCYGEKKLVAVRTATPPHLDGSGDDSAWQHAPVLKTFDRVAGLQLEIRSVYTDSDIYFLVSFPDTDESRSHKSWVWDKGRQIYTVGNDREDTFIFKWHMGAAPVDLSLNSDTPYTADIWFWKACRTNNIGYADDKIHEYSEVENRDAARVFTKSGKTMYLLRVGDEGSSAYKIDLVSEYREETMPRYILTEPSGSRGDVRAMGRWQNGQWTIELSRKLATSHGDDVQFVPGRNYLFGVSRFEIAGREPNEKLSEPLYGAGDVNEPLWLEFRP
jgi:hypothetical protein